MPSLDREQVSRLISGLTEAEADALLHDWSYWARPEQLEPDGDWWVTWLYMGGRGAGKTRTGAEWIRESVKAGVRSLGMIGSTTDDVRSVMIEGISGLLTTSYAGDRDKYGRPMGIPDFQPSKRRLVYENGAVVKYYSAEEPERLRGPQHERVWCDEVGAWQYAQETWDMMLFGLRVGEAPRVMATTTPRPIPLIKSIVREGTTVKTHSTTNKNRANLAPSFLKTIVGKFQGTRLGRQELEGELLEDIPGALFTRANIEKNRVTKDRLPAFKRIVVAVDPSGAGSDEDTGANEIGIVVAALGTDDKCYCLRDATLLGSPRTWAAVAVALFGEFGADCIVAEINYGGHMVDFVIRAIDPRIPYKPVTATRGKMVRAEPISTLAEQNRVKWVGAFPLLEDELCSFTQNGYVGGGSPNRGDAFIWAATELMLGDGYVLSDAMLS